ncbi:MAG: 16S rRNA (adenine(1518)-N(6)/adenine(1519)-N(6))-dimethyltransferase RsmA [Pseudomonadales bacterium]
MPVRKRFSQNFLHDQNTINRIVAAINPQPDDEVIEIGPGHGALTDELMRSGCNLHVIEIDFDLVRELRLRYGDAVDLIEADILKFDFSSIFGTRPVRIVGNLPYNISTPLLFKLFQHMDAIHDMYFMLQLEVVDRIVASPSTSDYGRLSVMCQYYCTPIRLFSVPATAFTPRPRVISSMIHLKPREPDSNQAHDVKTLENLLRRAFSQRRKTIRNALKPFLSVDDLQALGLDPQLRPENLTPQQYIDCANHIYTREQ